MRNIVKATGGHVTGITINEYQVGRTKQISELVPFTSLLDWRNLQCTSAKATGSLSEQRIVDLEKKPVSSREAGPLWSSHFSPL